MKPIYAIGNLGHVCVKIPCHGYEISIMCEDRLLRGNSLCTRCDVRVFNKEGDDVTEIFLVNTDSPTLDTLREIQEAILENM